VYKIGHTEKYDGRFQKQFLSFVSCPQRSSAGNPEKTSGALARINMSLIGLVIIAGANIIAAIIGQVLFGSWTAIINPQIYGPGAQ